MLLLGGRQGSRGSRCCGCGPCSKCGRKGIGKEGSSLVSTARGAGDKRRPAGAAPAPAPPRRQGPPSPGARAPAAGAARHASTTQEPRPRGRPINKQCAVSIKPRPMFWLCAAHAGPQGRAQEVPCDRDMHPRGATRRGKRVAQKAALQCSDARARQGQAPAAAAFGPVLVSGDKSSD
ncbi:MAG: hypothetical protein J3K34DRAFT_118132 [Monoraphidium minutum]|nr:MAG: hypothetical protein J3K34DRAFT_118132 [Monoraphidium minutum]